MTAVASSTQAACIFASALRVLPIRLPGTLRQVIYTADLVNGDAA
jgi:hypothetical protein